jgi:hypothetical protein
MNTQIRCDKKMKPEAKKKWKRSLFFIFITLCVIAHFLYLIWHLDWELSLYLLVVNVCAIGLLHESIRPPKKVRTSNYSKSLSFVGILISTGLFLLYCFILLGMFSEISQNDNLQHGVSIIVVAYIIFLSWYKQGWWEWGNKE